MKKHWIYFINLRSCNLHKFFLCFWFFFSGTETIWMPFPSQFSINFSNFIFRRISCQSKNWKKKLKCKISYRVFQGKSLYFDQRLWQVYCVYRKNAVDLFSVHMEISFDGNKSEKNNCLYSKNLNWKFRPFFA